MTPPPDSATFRILTEALGHKRLREIANVMRERDAGVLARRHLSAEAVEELAAMALKGDRPTLGWWRRHARSPVPAHEHRGQEAHGDAA